MGHPRPADRSTDRVGRDQAAYRAGRGENGMTDAFTQAGLQILTVSEPLWSPETPAELLPPKAGERSAFVCFLFFALQPP